jgi:hypothetical protein
MYGVDRFTAIILPPQSAILAIGRISEKTNTNKGWNPVQFICHLAIDRRPSFHHRRLTPANFLMELKTMLESPEAIFERVWKRTMNIPVEELKARVKRLQTRMRIGSIDQFIVFSWKRGQVKYLSGYHPKYIGEYCRCLSASQRGSKTLYPFSFRSGTGTARKV